MSDSAAFCTAVFSQMPWWLALALAAWTVSANVTILVVVINRCLRAKAAP